jgi:hypothetical protein
MTFRFQADLRRHDILNLKSVSGSCFARIPGKRVRNNFPDSQTEKFPTKRL